MATPTSDIYQIPNGVAVIRAGIGVPIVPITITQHPSSLTVTEPAAAAFSAAATAGVISWEQTTPPGATFATVPGATGSTYTISTTDDTVDSGRQIRARFTLGPDSVVSNVATLTVNTPAPVGQPQSGIVQYITHDGDAVGNVTTSSAPNRLYWNTVLEVPWARGTMGDWRDSLGVANGSTPYASFPAVTATGRRTLAVTALVQRWRTNGLNRGFYLSSRANAFPLLFAGRTASTPGDRPELVVVTTTGTFNLVARANASWNNTSVSVVSSAAQWELRAGQQPTILQFDLSTVTGTVTSATLGITLTTLTQTGAIIDVYEADPPVLFDPAVPLGAVQGIGALGNFAALQAHPNIIFAKDFATGAGQIDTSLWPQAITRTVDSTRGTTYASSFIALGTLAGADSRVNIVNSTTPGGVTNPAQRRDSAHATIRFRMASNFAGLTDRVKIPAMGSQLGWWNAAGAGYWQSTTGNGGFPGTGLKVVNAAAGNRVEYEGHSSRLTTGHRCSDVSAYSDYVRLATYIYHLDQVGAFPTEDTIPGLVLKRTTWYDMSHYLQLNSMSGAQDGLGNFATANPDGVYRLWINGQQVLNRTNYRWRRHAEFCVQGFWVDVYHGGTNPADRRMDFDVNELAIASSYIGPVRQSVQISGTTWTPNLDGAGNVLESDFAQLPTTWVRVNTNKIDDLVPATFQPNPPNGRYGTTVSGADGLHSVISAWSGAAWDWVNGRMYIAGGGHADSWGTENGVFAFDAKKMRFSMAVPRAGYNVAQFWRKSTQEYVAGTDPGGNIGPQIDGSPPASHTYHSIRWVPGTRFGGNTKGYFINHAPGPVTAVADLDTGTWLPGTWYNKYGAVQVDKDFSYATTWVEWPMMWSQGIGTPQQFAGMSFRLDLTQATDWSATSLTQRVTDMSGINIIYNDRLNAQLEERREMFNIGKSGSVVTAVRYRLSQAADALATNLGSYVDNITLVGPDAADFSAAALEEETPVQGDLWEAGVAYDHQTETVWIVPNRANKPIYRITGLSTNTWTVTKVTTAPTLSLSAQAGSNNDKSNGTYGRVRCFRIGGVPFLIRVSSTTTFAEVLRLA